MLFKHTEQLEARVEELESHCMLALNENWDLKRKLYLKDNQPKKQ